MDQIKINVNGQTVTPKQQPVKKEEDLKQISAKLHPEYDQDLISQIKQIPKRERSKIYRDALRKFLLDQKA